MDILEIKKLKDWFFSSRRDLPWRENTTPYAVWVSEVMLQQTQVSVVIPYFQKWMARFPTIKDLAKASIEDVLKAWEGLGYYSRARNLHEGACYVAKTHEGELPSTEQQLRAIKGLGDYTIGAILSFAFHQKAAAVDGNVLRVLTRYYCLFDDISKVKTVKMVQSIVHNFLPDHEPWLISEALIELGATICSRAPKCTECPLKFSCKGFIEGKLAQLPVKSVKTAICSLFRLVAMVMCDDHFLVRQEQKGKVMADLFQFPYWEMQSAEVDVETQKNLIKKALGLTLDWQMALPLVKHSFTRYRALLIPHLFKIRSFKEVKGYEWHSLEALNKLPFSSGHRQILTHLNESLRPIVLV